MHCSYVLFLYPNMFRKKVGCYIFASLELQQITCLKFPKTFLHFVTQKDEWIFMCTQFGKEISPSYTAYNIYVVLCFPIRSFFSVRFLWVFCFCCCCFFYEILQCFEIKKLQPTNNKKNIKKQEKNYKIHFFQFSQLKVQRISQIFFKLTQILYSARKRFLFLNVFYDFIYAQTVWKKQKMTYRLQIVHRVVLPCSIAYEYHFSFIVRSSIKC